MSPNSRWSISTRVLWRNDQYRTRKISSLCLISEQCANRFLLAGSVDKGLFRHLERPNLVVTGRKICSCAPLLAVLPQSFPFAIFREEIRCTGALFGYSDGCILGTWIRLSLRLQRHNRSIFYTSYDILCPRKSCRASFYYKLDILRHLDWRLVNRCECSYGFCCLVFFEIVYAEILLMHL